MGKLTVLHKLLATQIVSPLQSRSKFKEIIPHVLEENQMSLSMNETSFMSFIKRLNVDIFHFDCVFCY